MVFPSDATFFFDAYKVMPALIPGQARDGQDENGGDLSTLPRVAWRSLPEVLVGRAEGASTPLAGSST